MARTRSTSKKRSAASSSRRKPPESLVFFIDRSLGRKKVPEALRAAGLDIRVHDELFPQATQDAVWLMEAGAQRWVVITRSVSLTSSPANAFCPVSISYRTHPNAQRSLRLSAARPFAC